MKKQTMKVWHVVLMAVLTMGLCAQVAGAQALHVLMTTLRPALMDYLENTLIPDFEQEHGVRVRIEYTTWNERLDKILIQHAAGAPPDIVMTGFYSPYLEGSIGLLAPLDQYLATWEHTAGYPETIWETLRWDGQVYAVPLNTSVRGIGYHKQLFAEAGLDPELTPKSWEELLQYTTRLTRLDDSSQQVVQRGFYLDPRPSSGNAQSLFWFMLQNGVREVNLDTMESNLNHPKTLEALQFMLEIQEASHALVPAVSGGLPAGRTAMEWVAPGQDRVVLFSDPADLGIFAPQRSADLPPVSHAFVDGLAIVEASRNKDLAWEFIAALLDDESLMEVQRATGWISGRTELIRELVAEIPQAFQFLELYAYAQSSIIPPPRDIAQGDVATLLASVWRYELSPQEALLRADTLWTRLLKEWEAEIR